MQAQENRLDLVAKFMGQCAQKSLALSFEDSSSRGRCIALLFGFFDVLIDRGPRAKIQQVQDRFTSIDGDPIGDCCRSLIQYGQEHAPESRQFPKHIHDAITVEASLMPM